MRKTKIVCTLGPATDDEQVLRQLFLNGMNVARLNFSHGTYEAHQKRIDAFKKVRNELNLPIALLLDTKGPEIRIGYFETESVELIQGKPFTLTTKELKGNEKIVSVSYKALPRDVKPGTRILIADGLIELVVEDVSATEIKCVVAAGGTISSQKSINVPGIKLSMPFLSKKDEEDIIFGIQNDFDYIAASFTRCADDVLDIKRVLEHNGGKDIHIIAKIENSDGVQNIDEILKVSDGIMVARGDMGVEIAFEELPRIQKLLIKKGYSAGKKVITATQMLESMIVNARPTRAEATDVANAIYDGTSAIMLSGETAIGKYPVESLTTMSRIALSTEDNIHYEKRFNELAVDTSSDVTNAISHATCTTAQDLRAAAIITVTKSGSTARMVSKFRPSCPIVGCTTEPRVYRQLAMSWGVLPMMAEEKSTTDELFDHAVEKAVEAGVVKNGDLVVITAGIPLGISGTTNILKVHIVGHVLVSGTGVLPSSVCGTLCVCKDEDEAIENFEDGNILVIPETSNKILSIMKKCRGIVTETEGRTSHAAIVGLTLDIPVICGAANATSILKSGTTVTLDGTSGLVYYGEMKM